jgi:MFS transporter, PPP family, 3-phenylpropionic acid transporter
MRISEANRLRLLYFLVFCCTASWLPIFADYLKSRGLNGIETGMILSITPVMMFLVQPFYGMVADRIGYKKCLLVSAAFASLGYAAYLHEGSFPYLMMVTVFMSLFYNTLQPLLDSLSLTLAQRDRRFSYGSLRIAGAAGWAFTGIFVGHYIDVINTSVIFVFSSVSLLLTFLFALFLRLDHKKSAGSQPPAFRNIRNVFVNKAFIVLLVAVFLISVGATTIWNFYSIYMKENGASASLVGLGISFQGLCELPFFYFSARIIRRLGIKTTLLITFFATALRLFLYGTVRNPQAAIFIELLHGVSWSLFWVVCVESADHLVKEEWRATGQSLLYAAYFGIGAIAGNFWTGYLYDSQLRIADIFLLNSGIVTVVSVGMWYFVRNRNFAPASIVKPQAGLP